MLYEAKTVKKILYEINIVKRILYEVNTVKIKSYEAWTVKKIKRILLYKVKKFVISYISKKFPVSKFGFCAKLKLILILIIGID